MMQRMLEFTPNDGGPKRDVTVTVLMPEVDPTSPDRWRAMLRIEGMGELYEQFLFGVDSFQAGLGAAGLAPVMLRSLAHRDGKLTFRGRDDLFFEL